MGAALLDRPPPYCDSAINGLVPFLLAHNLGSFLGRIVLPPEMGRWSLTALRQRLVEIGARLIRHARRLILQMVEVAIPRGLFGQILSRLLPPAPT